MNTIDSVLQAIKRYRDIFQEPIVVTRAEPSQIDLDIGPYKDMKEVLDRLEILLPNHWIEGNLLVSDNYPTVRVYR